MKPKTQRNSCFLIRTSVTEREAKGGQGGHRMVDSTRSFMGKASVCECGTNRFAK